MAKLSWFPWGRTAADDTTARLAKPTRENRLAFFDAHSVAAKMPEFR
jgi:hypothetical protein